MIRRSLNHGAADALGLEEGPEVGGLDVLAEGLGLGALAQRLREREKQRDHRDQQSDLLVGAGSMLGMLGVLHAFMCAHDSLPAKLREHWPIGLFCARGNVSTH